MSQKFEELTLWGLLLRVGHLLFVNSFKADNH